MTYTNHFPAVSFAIDHLWRSASGKNGGKKAAKANPRRFFCGWPRGRRFGGRRSLLVAGDVADQRAAFQFDRPIGWRRRAVQVRINVLGDAAPVLTNCRQLNVPTILGKTNFCAPPPCIMISK